MIVHLEHTHKSCNLVNLPMSEVQSRVTVAQGTALAVSA